MFADPLIPALLIVFAASLTIQLFYWIFFHARLLYQKLRPGNTRKFPVSVIICAKNEAENLEKNLPLILDQEFQDYEVVVVNDASTDETAELLREMARKDPRLKVRTLEDNPHLRPGKKLALTVGIRAAIHDWVVLTDADCRPAGREWLRTLQRNFRRQHHIILGYGGYEPRNSLLNLLIRYETLFIAMQYMGYALAGVPYMGIGRNLAYRKKLFYENRGFASHYELASGDDDLFIHEVASPAATGVVIDPASFTRSDPELTWKHWFRQKRRHLTTGPRYRWSVKLLLGMENLSRMLFYLSFILLLSLKIMQPWVLSGFFLRLLLTTLVIKRVMGQLNEKQLLLPSPLLDFALPYLHMFMIISNYIARKRSRWN